MKQYLKKHLLTTILRCYRDTRGYFCDTRRKNRDNFLKLLPSNSVCAEVGVFQGNFSKRILKITKPKLLFLIDLWDTEYAQTLIKLVYGKPKKNYNLEQEYAIVIAKFAHHDNVKIIRQDSVKALESFPDNFFDWVYIDDDHTYDYVKRDLEASLKKVKVNGLITGDDYSMQSNYRKNNVLKAVHEFINVHNYELKIMGDQFIIKNEKHS